MINFKVKLTLKKYFVSKYLRLIKGSWKTVLSLSLFGSIIFVYLQINNMHYCDQPFAKGCDILSFGIFFIFSTIFSFPYLLLFLIVLILFVLPLIKFCFARFYYKQDSMEYFFGKDEFGWELAGNKLSYRVKLLDYIKIYPDYLLIQLNMKKIYLIFLADEKTISDVVKKLKKTKYKQYLR